jgi:DNA invertase Pin-like site-specific DNA recombinase
MSDVRQNSPGHVGAVCGYARTSTTDQRAGLEAQIAELEAAGCTRIYREHVSAIDPARPELLAALDWVRAGDSFVVTKPDRLARSVTDLMAIVDRLQAKDVSLRILSLNLTTGDPTSNLVLSLLGAIGSWEREIMLERQRAGIAKAKAEGRYKGRAPTARAKAQQITSLKAEGKTVAEIKAATGVSRASIYRVLNEAA